MATVLGYRPMSDPFAPNPATRYSTPPLSRPTQSTSSSSSSPSAPPLFSQQIHAQAVQAQTAAMQPQRRATAGLVDEFGYSPGGSTSQSTSAARARASHVPTGYVDHSASVAAQQAQAQAARQRHRQSHDPAATLAYASSSPTFKEEYLSDEWVLNPSVHEYTLAHPNRSLAAIKPYVFLQTLGEGEFGKVKLAVHTRHGVEVAIKLIRRGSLEDEAKLSKVQREIDVLRMLHHPNIVRMLEVLKTDKYIGIVLEYAGGGELFEHILANKYLRDKDASKLFAQLISGVDYLHKKNIVHRDLKLENLLLDKNRNIIITDFGFANRFDTERDDLMATSCGSPCYAAPELVISEGLYRGSAVDIWSCGVILYAMLSGYLPWDDDPANPDGDNINLLYKYIVSTKLNFPDHMSDSAKSLLRIMLVADPERRCTIDDIKAHPWLSAHRDVLRRSPRQQEAIFYENMALKRDQARRDLEARQRLQEEAKMAKVAAVTRSQSSMPGSGVSASMLDHQRRVREGKHRSALPGTTTMPEYLNNAGRAPLPLAARQPLAVAPPVPAAAQTSPVIADAPLMSAANFPARTIPPEAFQPLAPPVTLAEPALASASASTEAVENVAMDVEPAETVAPVASAQQPTPPRPPMSANKNRHTIQVEYDGEATYEKMQEILEAKRVAAAGGPSIPSLSLGSSPNPQTSPHKRVFELQGLSSDVEMDSESSDQGHMQVDMVESSVEPMTEGPSGDAWQILNPPSDGTTPDGAHEAETPSELVAPSTPRHSGRQRSNEITSPSTPRAAAKAADAEDVMTPRAKAVTTTPRGPDGPRSGGKRFDSMPARAHATVPLSTAPLPAQPALNAAGLPQVPAPKRDRYRKGLSLDKFGLAKLLGTSNPSSSVDVSRPPPSAGAAAAALQQAQNEPVAPLAKRGSLVRPRTADADPKDKKNRRKTLQLMVNRSSSIRNSKTSVATPSTPAPLSARDLNPASTPATAHSSVSAKAKPSPPVLIEAQPAHQLGQGSASVVTVDNFAAGQAEAPKQLPASSSAAKKVMDWFRRKSMARDTLASLKTSGVRSDSASSFVQVSDSPVRAARDRRMAESASNLNAIAMSSTSSVGQQTDEIAETTTKEAQTVPDSATVPKDQAIIQASRPIRTASPARVPLGSAASKTNIVPPTATGSSTDLLALNRVGNTPTPTRSKSAAAESTMAHPQHAGPAIVPRSVPLGSVSRYADEVKMRVHTGLVDQNALSSRPPREVMADVTRVLREMGIEISPQNDFKLKCVRARKRKSGATTGLGLGSVMSVGSTMGSLINSASVSRTDSRGLPLPSASSGGLLSGGGIRGMLLRRGSSYSSTHPNLVRSDSDIMFGSPTPSSTEFGSPAMMPSPTIHEPIYGEHSVDDGDELRFSVELCRMKNLPGLYLLSIKRMRGNLWSFKFIYQTTLQRCEALTH